jgi:hypothetical protein
MADLPIACTLEAASLAERSSELIPGLARLASDRVSLPDGLRLTFAAEPGVLASITRTIDLEQTCCRFLRFQVTVEPAGGPIVLDITGPPGTEAFLQQLVARW